MKQLNASSDSWGYCDITKKEEACIEIDLLEANVQAVQATLHAEPSLEKGRCRQERLL